eukprot:scaffold294_cov221-Amphora_coffeaeformis.AAC.42
MCENGSFCSPQEVEESFQCQTSSSSTTREVHPKILVPPVLRITLEASRRGRIRTTLPLDCVIESDICIGCIIGVSISHGYTTGNGTKEEEKGVDFSHETAVPSATGPRNADVLWSIGIVFQTRQRIVNNNKHDGSNMIHLYETNTIPYHTRCCLLHPCI